MNLRRSVLGAALATGLSTGLAAAQDALLLAPMAVLTLDQDRLFSGSAYGRETLSAVEREAQALQAENRRIEADLESEEKQLTERRATMVPEEFRAAADAFDEKVKGIRTAQTAKARDLSTQRDAARQRFLQAAAPILAEIMTERDAVAILDRSAIILSFDRADITDLAIARVDSVLVTDPAEAPAPDAGGLTAPEPSIPALGPSSAPLP